MSYDYDDLNRAVISRTQYPKSINTIPQDVYKRLEEPTLADPVHLQRMADDVQLAVKRALEDSRGEGNRYLRMSKIGLPDRKIWYDLRLESPTHKMSGKELLNFLLGHILEAVMLCLVREAGHIVEHEQAQVELEGVVGHLDAFIDGALVDVKTASDYGFKKFQTNSLVNGDDPYGYIGQISGYTQATGAPQGAFLAINKNNGQLAITHVPEHKEIDAAARIVYLKEMLKKDTPPERCYQEVVEDNGNKSLPKMCQYCPHKQLCWGDSNNGAGLRVFKYSNGAKFLTHVAKEPKVEDITETYFKLEEDSTLPTE
jgi:hypothetical protein